METPNHARYPALFSLVDSILKKVGGDFKRYFGDHLMAVYPYCIVKLKEKEDMANVDWYF